LCTEHEPDTFQETVTVDNNSSDIIIYTTQKRQRGDSLNITTRNKRAKFNDNNHQQSQTTNDDHQDTNSDGTDDVDNGCIFKTLSKEQYGYRKFHEWIKEDMVTEIEKYSYRYNENGFDFDVDRMLTNLKTPCGEKCRFSIPEFAQVAADTLHIPITICDNITSNRVYLPISALFRWRKAIILYFKDHQFIECKTCDTLSVSLIAKLNTRHMSVCKRLGWSLGIRNAYTCYTE